MHAPVLSVLRHTATALHVMSDKVGGTMREELLQRAAMLTDARAHMAGLEEAITAHLRYPSDITAIGLREALNRVRGEA